MRAPLVATVVALVALVAGLVAPAPALAPAAASTTGAGAVSAPARDGVWPLQPRPRVVAGFAPPAVRWGSGHRGVDLAGRPGAPVHAALAGQVAWVGSIAGVASISVSHGELRTTYQPVTASVAVGDTVGRGQVIGLLSRAGSHCYPGTCLHWGLRRGETYLDPLLLVGGGPVRLLPLTGGPRGTGAGASPRLGAAVTGAVRAV